MLQNHRRKSQKPKRIKKSKIEREQLSSHGKHKWYQISKITSTFSNISIWLSFISWFWFIFSSHFKVYLSGQNVNDVAKVMMANKEAHVLPRSFLSHLRADSSPTDTVVMDFISTDDETEVINFWLMVSIVHFYNLYNICVGNACFNKDCCSILMTSMSRCILCRMWGQNGDTAGLYILLGVFNEDRLGLCTCTPNLKRIQWLPQKINYDELDGLKHAKMET